MYSFKGDYKSAFEKYSANEVEWSDWNDEELSVPAKTVLEAAVLTDDDLDELVGNGLATLL